MSAVDDFVFLDDVQMPVGRSYVSRVQIRGRDGGQWFTVPVRRVCGEGINSVQFAEDQWSVKHLATLRANYSRCPFFTPVMELLQPIYDSPGQYLAPFNVRLITTLAAYLGLAPRFHLSSAMAVQGTGTERLVNIVSRLGGTTYVSGQGGTKYQDAELFKTACIDLEVRVYSPVQYPQIHGDFVPGLSILDAVFHFGPRTRGLLQYPSPARGYELQ
jgi:hypothetical protein